MNSPKGTRAECSLHLKVSQGIFALGLPGSSFAIHHAARRGANETGYVHVVRAVACGLFGGRLGSRSDLCGGS